MDAQRSAFQKVNVTTEAVVEGIQIGQPRFAKPQCLQDTTLTGLCAKEQVVLEVFVKIRNLCRSRFSLGRGWSGNQRRRQVQIEMSLGGWRLERDYEKG